MGINSVGYNGNIGTFSPADPGINTLWSNYSAAIDINSNISIITADNFGVSNISFPLVQIVSNRPYYSTASCGHQIYNTIPQNNLNIKYLCNNYTSMFSTLNGIVGSFTLSANYQNLLHNSLNQFDDANLILTSLETTDISLLNAKHE